MSNNQRLKAIEIIQKKLQGKKLNYEEYYTLIKLISEKKLDDILLTYFVAATYENPPSLKELYYFTKAMVDAGTTIQFTPPVADKHSTGGVPGNRVTLILVPIIASLGIKIPKTSSRAITSPAGTADCMETIAEVSFSPKEVKNIVEKTNGCIIWGGNLNIAPADDELIRVEKPIQLEAEDKVIVSIMAKKLAVSSTHLVLDIPYSQSLKIKTKSQAEKIAEKFKKLAKLFGIKIKTFITHSEKPLARTAGPALETYSSLLVLEQDENKPLELEEKTINLASELYKLVTNKPIEQAQEEVKKTLKTGKALQKFKEIIKAQKGDPTITAEKLMQKIESKTKQLIVKSNKTGKIGKFINKNASAIAQILGAPKNKFSGIYMFKQTGENIKKGEPLFKLFSDSEDKLKEAKETLDYFPIFEIK